MVNFKEDIFIVAPTIRRCSFSLGQQYGKREGFVAVLYRTVNSRLFMKACTPWKALAQYWLLHM